MACCILLALIVSQFILVIKKIKSWFGIVDDDVSETVKIEAQRKRRVLKSVALVVTFLSVNSLLIYMNQDHVSHFIQEVNEMVNHKSSMSNSEHHH